MTEMKELEQQKFIKLTGKVDVKFEIIEYTLKTDDFQAKWRIEIPEPNPFHLTEGHSGEIKIFKDKSSFSVFSLKSLKHFLFVLEKVKMGEYSLDHIYYLWKDRKES